jgi:hypothetical protein
MQRAADDHVRRRRRTIGALRNSGSVTIRERDNLGDEAEIGRFFQRA